MRDNKTYSPRDISHIVANHGCWASCYLFCLPCPLVCPTERIEGPQERRRGRYLTALHIGFQQQMTHSTHPTSFQSSEANSCNSTFQYFLAVFTSILLKEMNYDFMISQF
jgi:hypothetical protein